MEEAAPTVDADLAQARAAFGRDDLRHAAGRLAGALAGAPSRPEVHELLSRLAARTDGGLELFPLDERPFLGTVLARAHLLAAAGRHQDGLLLLAVATAQQPGGRWADVPWVSDPALGSRLEPDLLARLVMRLCTAVADPAPETDRAGLRPYLTLMRHAIAAYPGHPLLLGAGSALARRMGEAVLAVNWARRGADAQPSKLAEIWLGYAHRSAGQPAEAIAALRRAVDHDPDDLTVYADIAGLLADGDRLDEALIWIERAVQRDPTFGCAVHTAHRLRYRADGDPAHLVRLADFGRDHPDDAHEHTDLAECCFSRPWLGGVPTSRRVIDTRARAALPTTPAPAAARQLCRLARPVWPHPPAAYDAAVGLALIPAPDLLALLLHPPAAPDTATGWAAATRDPNLWVRSVQVWACLGLLHHRTDEPWPRSTRRRLLVELAAGGPDRITEAALFALVAYAWVDPAVRPDVAGVVTRRLTDLASTGDHPATTTVSPDTTAVAWSVAHLALATPALDDTTRRLATTVVRTHEASTRRGTPRRVARLLRRLTDR